MKTSSTDLNTDCCGIPLVTLLIVKNGHLSLSFVSSLNQFLTLKSPFLVILDNLGFLSVYLGLLKTL